LKGHKWSLPKYWRHLNTPDPDDRRNERTAAEAVLHSFGLHNCASLCIVQRPDEMPVGKGKRTPPRPDFLAEDAETGLRVAVEVTRPMLTEEQEKGHHWRCLERYILSALPCDLECAIFVTTGCHPPRRGPDETALCNEIASRVATRAKLVDERLGPHPSPEAVDREDRCVDLSDLPSLGGTSFALVLNCGEERSVKVMLVPWESSPESYSSRQDQWMDWYRKTLGESDCKLSSWAQAGYETILVLDDRAVRSVLAWGVTVEDMEQVRHAGFSNVHHVILLRTGEAGLTASHVWNADDVRLGLPTSSTFLPPGWVEGT